MNKIKLRFLGLCSLFVGAFQKKTYGLANEASTTTRSAQHWKRKTAMAIGKPDLAEGDDEALEAAHDAHMQMANEMASMDEPPGPAEAANELEAARRESAELLIANAVSEGRIRADAATAWAEEFTADYDAAKTSLANEKKASESEAANEQMIAIRKENADMQIANALTSGRILPSEKKSWEGKFAADYDAAKIALSNEKTVKVKVTPRTASLGGANAAAVANEEDRRKKVHSLVNEEMKRNGNDYDAAFSTVQTDHKELFEAMKKPAAKS